ncbi:MAG: DUF559 domain-containing protein [Nodosilinea sp.]
MFISEHGLDGYLTKIAAGKVKTFLCAQTIDTLSQIESAGVGDRRLVVQTWETLPQPNQLVTDILQTLAEAAHGIWPAWYSQDEPFLDEATAETTLLNQFKCLDLKRASQDICLPWLKQAVRACQTRRVPVLPEFSRSLQLSQLLLAIEPNHVVIVVVVADPAPAKHQLLSLAKAVQWLADKTQAPIALMLPEQMRNVPELDSVLYGTVSLAAATAVDDGQSSADTIEGTANEEAKHILVPVRGRPHPFSPGEKLLAERLTRDAELGPLFQFNRTVRTVYDSAYLVDLLWADGQVVIEVDGYRYHSNTFAFSRDRHRDYELLISGYVVLRLPHDEVVSDVELTVEKIRDVVRFRRRQTRPISKVSP